jgi:predicted Zn-dependent protease
MYKHDDRIQRVMHKAERLARRGKLAKAIALYSKILAVNPHHAMILLKIAALQARSGATPEAVETYLGAADHFSARSRHAKAIAVLCRAQALDGRRVELNLRLAELYDQTGDSRRALAQLRRAADHPHATRAQRLQALTQIVKLTPESIPDRLRLAELQGVAGLVLLALRDLESLLDRLLAEQDPRWISVADKLLDLRPDHWVLLDLARARIRCGQPRDAVQRLEAALGAGTETRELLQLLALALDKLGRAHDAEQVRTRLHQQHRQLDHHDGVPRIGRQLARQPRGLHLDT